MTNRKRLKILFIGMWLGGLFGCMNKSHEHVVIMATGLQNLNQYWEEHGQPKEFEPTNVMKSSWEVYSVFTNDFRVANNVYHCRFAARSKLVRIPGTLAITDKGVLLWIGDKDGRVVVSPEKNGIKP